MSTSNQSPIGASVQVDFTPALTQALKVAEKLIDFGKAVWDATPKEMQTQSASDWAKFNHNVSDFVTGIQEQINKLVHP